MHGKVFGDLQRQEYIDPFQSANSGVEHRS
ncbi:hypothetical protein BH18ACT14_BH18ACT14_02340 [soil metagenome]